ncbi:hypothetical protein GCM10027047_11820 [Rhodococcus aerolatus]
MTEHPDRTPDQPGDPAGAGPPEQSPAAAVPPEQAPAAEGSRAASWPPDPSWRATPTAGWVAAPALPEPGPAAARGGARRRVGAAVGAGVLLLGLGGAVGFGLGHAGAGTTTAAVASPVAAATAPQGTAPGTTGGATGTGAVRAAGTIASVDSATTFTLQTTDGADVTVTTTGQTRLLSQTGDEVGVGTAVVVQGTQAGDGTITARVVVAGASTGGSGTGGSGTGGSGTGGSTGTSTATGTSTTT